MAQSTFYILPISVALLTAVFCPLIVNPVAAQPVVQALPPQGVSDLNTALRDLARNSNNVGALIDAANASLKIGDVDAAIGFFGRAEELSPGDARIKLGLAQAYISQQRPLDALRLFAEAEQRGISTQAFASDRGLAYDLAGDTLSARQQYLLALSVEEDAAVRERLALNYAIAGDRSNFERILLPLLSQNSMSAFRIRAFGLAILGDEAEAVAITQQIMPSNQAALMVPYLRYMPRLTRAQQAAAANLGVFPQAAQMGRDAPRIAQYSAIQHAPPTGPMTSDSRLTPQGEPLGRLQASAGGTLINEPAKTAPAAKAPRGDTRRAARETDPLLRTRAAGRVRTARADVPQLNNVQTEPVGAASRPVETVLPERSAALQGSSAPVELAARPSASAELPSIDVAPSQQLPSVQQTQQTQTFGPVETVPMVQRAPASVAAAFSDFVGEAKMQAPATKDRVDITAITPRREIAKPVEKKVAAVEPKPKPALAPRRYWVQVATGRDRAALAFDWRRINRKAGAMLAGKKGFVAKWGETNRLLTGPFDNAKAAAGIVASLTKDGIDSFAFTSAEGEEVQPIE